ncbi:MAG: anhydro-N-acetylmuramic acid kinase, partial [Chitinophagaceae bacterium]
MVYRAIGVMSGSSLDGLDIAFAEFQEQGGKWTYAVKQTACYSYEEGWRNRLANAISLTALDYQLLHTDFGHYIGEKVNAFINDHELQYQVALIASHGHTSFHVPGRKMTAQLGDGAAIAALTRLPVVTDLRAMDIAFGGQGAPIVPVGEKLLMGEYAYFLNIGGIANISINTDHYTAFDVCPANRVLNMLANEAGQPYDNGGAMAESGTINNELLERLNQLEYYKKPSPKSLANDFGTDIVYPLVKNSGLDINDSLRTYTEHIAVQIKNAFSILGNHKPQTTNHKLLATGGGAFNLFLVRVLREKMQQLNIELVVPDADLVSYKEALIMAFIGVLRWRQEYNVLSSVTGASRDSIGGAL